MAAGLIAQADRVPTEFGVWIACLVVFLGVAVLMVKLFVRKPSLEAEFVNKIDFGKFEAEVRADFVSVRRDLADLNNENARDRLRVIEELHKVKDEILMTDERRLSALYDELKPMREDIAMLKERTNNQGPRP